MVNQKVLPEFVSVYADPTMRRWGGTDLVGSYRYDNQGVMLMYLPASTVEALATEGWQESGVAYWMSDITTTAFAKAIQMDTFRSVRKVQATDSLCGEQILDTVRRHGWVSVARRSYITDMAFAMERIRRLMGDRPQPSGPPPVAPDDPTGVHLFARG
jgi:hypothetical protein